ncbi:MAG: type II secretion system F family protein [Planctomycetota bacterium]|jgi:tight adherence protein C|nr:type II secretion system F family protein [Planctomycetota bacterium]
MELLVVIYILVFLAAFLFVATLFRAPIETEDEKAFRIEIDNVDRDTVFEVPWMRPILVPTYHLVRRLNMPGFKKHILKLLLAVGNPRQYSPDEYLVICVLWGVIGAVLTFLLARVASGEIGLVGAALYLVAGFLGGFFCAYLWLRERALLRLRNISRRLPYALDLIAMAMDAGATFYEAAKAVVRDDPYDPLNEELNMVIREIDFGRSRQDALTHLGKRIDVEGLDGILSAVLQAEALGTPLATVLKLQANLLRMRRSMRAERKAGEAAVKILVPSMLILISVVLIIFAPIIVRGIEGRYLQ